MKNLKPLLFGPLVGSILILNSCASIVSKSNYPLQINTEPSESQIVIKDASGTDVYKGTSPAVVQLKAGAKYFKKAGYVVNITKDGYLPQTVPVNFRLDGWYFGNIVFGGLIGMLIVDPASGAMYKIETDNLNIKLLEGQSSTSISTPDSPALKIYDYAKIPDELKGKLVRLK